MVKSLFVMWWSCQAAKLSVKNFDQQPRPWLQHIVIGVTTPCLKLRGGLGMDMLCNQIWLISGSGIWLVEIIIAIAKLGWYLLTGFNQIWVILFKFPTRWLKFQTLGDFCSSFEFGWFLLEFQPNLDDFNSIFLLGNRKNQVLTNSRQL